MSQGQAQGLNPGAGSGRRPAGSPTEDQVREELSRVLACHEFRSSKRSQDFLRYVVENTLQGHGDMLKERTIGIEVFGRPTSYDPSDDATVRVKAGEVRKRLGIYYSDLGSHNPVRIELPSGTYVPEFHVLSPPPAEPGVSNPPAAPAPPVASAPVERKRLFTPRRAVLAGLLAAAAAMVFFLTRPAATPLDEFWAPVLTGTSPLQLCAAYVPVYGVDIDPTITPPSSVGDFTLLTDQFVGGGDLIATSRLVAMLARLHRPYRVKLGNDVSFTDLRSGPAILVGFSYTKWKQISSQMRFFVDGFRRRASPITASPPNGFCPRCRATGVRRRITRLFRGCFIPILTRCWWRSPASRNTARTQPPT